MRRLARHLLMLCSALSLLLSLGGVGAGARSLVVGEKLEYVSASGRMVLLLSKNGRLDVVFHPASTTTAACALVSNLNQNRVTPVLVTPSGLSPQPALSPISLAAELDVVERGSHAGTAFVSSVTRVARVQFQLNGSGTTPTTAIDFGAATTNITGAVGIQR